jgi:Protein of unknown function (DUF3363)
MHRALLAHGIEHPPERYLVHLNRLETPILGRLVGKGLSSDELNDRVHLVVDGTDGSSHYFEIADLSQIDAVKLGGIVEVTQEQVGARTADRTIANLARSNGIYRPSEHLAFARQNIRVPNDDHEGYVAAHVRRLEALRRAGMVDRVNADHWRIPEDFEARAAAHETKRNREVSVRVLSTIDLVAQIRADGATWLDRQLIGRNPTQLAQNGFGLEVAKALDRRKEWFIERGLAQRATDNKIQYRRDLLLTLERRELMRVGESLSEDYPVPFRLAQDGERIRGRLKETVQLASGKYALVQNAQEFFLVPWRPVIKKEIGKEVRGVMRGNSVSWEFGRKRGLEI